MSLENRPITSVYEVYQLYCRQLDKDNLQAKTDPKAVIKTALRYVAHGYDLPKEANKKEALEFLKTISLAQLPNAPDVQQKVFDAQKVSGGSQRTYRWALKKMIEWCTSQAWWSSALSNPIITPPSRSRHKGHVGNIRLTKRKQKPAYGLTDEEISDASVEQLQKSSETFMPLNEELQKFYKFMTDVDVPKRQGRNIKDITARNYINEVRYMLGWMHRYHSPAVPLAQLNLAQLVSSSGLTTDGRTDEEALDNVIDEIYDYLSWKRTERETGPGSELESVKGLVWVAAFLYHQVSKRQQRSGRSTGKVKYRDIPVIEQLRELQNEISERLKNAPRVADEDKKWLEWPEFLACVNSLKTELNPIGQNNQRRSNSAIAASYQRYLIFAFLSAIPDRQRTLRELEEGRTLFKRNGLWLLEHGADDFKTGETYCQNGKKRIISIPEWFYPELEAWLHGYEDQLGNWHGYIDEEGNRLGWRAVFKPNHSRVFTKKCGNEMARDSLWSLFRHAAYRLTGKACNPHLVRDMIITYMKRTGASSNVLDSLAQLMAHSLEMQQSVYDRRTSQEKVEPALSALSSVRLGSLPTVPLSPIQLDPIDPNRGK
jgi:hypothetical protein